MARKKSREYNTIIKMLMVRDGITQEKLANLLGLSPVATNKKLNGKSSWVIDECIMLTKIFNVTLDDIFLSMKVSNGNKKNVI